MLRSQLRTSNGRIIRGKGTFEKMWEPLLRAKLGECYERTAASFIWAHINRMYKARRTGFKKEMFGYVRGGYRTIISTLAERLENLNVRIRVGDPISNIVRQSDGTFEIINNNDRCIVDRVIITTSNSVVPRICPQLSANELEQLRKTEYLGICCASMILQKPISPYYVTNITDSWVPMTAVIEMSNVVAHEETGGKTLVYLPKYVPAEHALFEQSDEQIIDEFLSGLLTVFPKLDKKSIITNKVSRARQVTTIPTLGYSTKKPDTTTTIPGLHICNSAQISNAALSVNESVKLANTFVNDLLRNG